MNILIIADDYVPQSKKVSAKMLHELACYFKFKGHCVTCIVSNSYKEAPYEELNGIIIYRFNSGRIKNVNKFRRAINELRFSNKVWKTVKFNQNIRADLVIYYSPSIFFGNAIKRIKRHFGISSYLILRDFFPQWVIDHGMIKEKSLITRLFRYYEKINYLAADFIGVMSPANLKWFNQYTDYHYATHSHVLYNWVDQKFLTCTEPNTDFRKQYHLEDKVIFIYGGNIGNSQNMMSIIKLAERLKTKSKAFFLIIGEGDEYSLVDNKIKELSLTNTLLLRAMLQNEYYSIQKIADIGLFCLNADHKTHNFPGKILGYMAQGMPILGCVNQGNDLIEIINGNNAGYISYAGDDARMVKNAIKLIDSKVERQKCSENSKLLLNEFFDVSSAANTILGVISGQSHITTGI